VDEALVPAEHAARQIDDLAFGCAASGRTFFTTEA
jgi:hypothetical protein